MINTYSIFSNGTDLEVVMAAAPGWEEMDRQEEELVPYMAYERWQEAERSADFDCYFLETEEAEEVYY